MTKSPRTFSPAEKSRIAIVAIRGEKTTAQISSDFQIHPTQVGLWKKQAMDNLADIFNDKRKRIEKQNELEKQNQLDNLYKIIGQKDQELDWLKKKLSIFKS